MSFWSGVTRSGGRVRAHTTPRFIRRLPVWLTVLAVVLATPSTVVAQGNRTAAALGMMPDAIAKVGVQSRVGMAWDCVQPDRAPNVVASANNGSVVVKKGKAPSCGLPSVDVTFIYYTPKPGFKGTDNLFVMSLQTGGQVQRLMRVLVK